MEALAEYSRLPIVSVSDLTIPENVANLIPEQTALEHALLPIQLENDTLTVATCDPYQFEAFDAIQARTDFRVRAKLAAPRALRSALAELHGGEEALHDLIKNSPLDAADVEMSGTSGEGDEVEEEDGVESLEGNTDAPVIRFLRLVVADAIRQGAASAATGVGEEG